MKNLPPTQRRTPALDVAVVGGGMVGAAAALALSRAGFSTALLEARAPAVWHAQLDVDLRVVALAPSSIKLLNDLGVWTSIRDARACAYAHMHVWDAENGAAIDFDAASQGQDSLGYIVENNLVQWQLWQALDKAGVKRWCPATVTAFQTHADRVTLQLADGQSVAARLLVAADGGDSPLREKAGIATGGRDYSQRAVVAHIVTERPHGHTCWQRFLPTGPLALLPLADGRSSIVWSLPDSQAHEMLSLDDEAFGKALGVASDLRLGRIMASTQRVVFPITLKVARSYRAERFVLLGDAAHVVHPLAGQGVNLGLRDVVELRDVLAAARDAGSDFASPHVLKRYARRRRSADTLDAYGLDAIARMYAWQSPPWVAARGLGMRLVNRLQPLKRRLAVHAAGIQR